MMVTVVFLVDNFLFFVLLLSAVYTLVYTMG